MIIKIKKIDERAIIPTYAHDGDVCMDFTAIDVEYDKEEDLYIYHTGLSFESDFEIGQFLFPRSSNRRTNAYLCNSVGVADSAIYRGEIMFCYKNRDSINTILVNEFLSEVFKRQVKDFTEFSEVYLEKTKEINKKVKNLEYAPYKVGERIGQFCFIQTPKFKLEIVEELSDSVRGENGFGSSGK